MNKQYLSSFAENRPDVHRGGCPAFVSQSGYFGGVDKASENPAEALAKEDVMKLRRIPLEKPRSLGREASLSVHLVTYNGAACLPYCLESLAQSSWQHFFLLIIDNASLDDSVARVKYWLSRYPDLNRRTRLVQNKQNFGFARAHNQAIAWSGSEYVMLLNQDVVLAKTYLEKLIQALIQAPACAAVSGKLRQWEFDPATFYYNSLEDLDTLKRLDSTGLAIKRCRQVIDRDQGKIDNNLAAVPQEIFGVSGAAALYRRSALRAVSPANEIFDEDFGSYKEDVDIAWRLQWAGYGALYIPSAVAYHKRGFGAASRDTIWTYYRRRRLQPPALRVAALVNHWAVLIKNDCWYNWWRDCPWFIGFEGKRILYLLFFEPVVLAQSLCRFIKLLPRFVTKRRLLKTTHKIAPSALRRWWL